MTHLFNSRRRCVPSLGSQARLGQEHTGDLQKECCTNGYLASIRPSATEEEKAAYVVSFYKRLDASLGLTTTPNASGKPKPTVTMDS